MASLPQVKRDKWCRHRTPFSSDIRVCKAGVEFHQFTDGQPHDSVPCLGENAAAIARCEKYSGWTDEELSAREAANQARFERIGLIRGEIVKTVESTGQRSGLMQCPACKTGTVGWSMASNGHVHARCSTDGCASWME